MSEVLCIFSFHAKIVTMIKEIRVIDNHIYNIKLLYTSSYSNSI